MKDDLGTVVEGELLELSGPRRVRWLNFLKENPLSANYEILIPLYQKLEAKPAQPTPEIVKIPVAVYKRDWDRGKYVQFRYAGDDWR